MDWWIWGSEDAPKMAGRTLPARVVGADDVGIGGMGRATSRRLSSGLGARYHGRQARLLPPWEGGRGRRCMHCTRHIQGWGPCFQAVAVICGTPVVIYKCTEAAVRASARPVSLVVVLRGERSPNLR